MKNIGMGITFCLWSLGVSAETIVDAQTHLTQILQSKGHVSKQRTVNYIERVCRNVERGSRDSRRTVKECNNWPRTRVETYTEALKVVDVEPDLVEELAYGDAERVTLPDIPHFKSFTITNCSAEVQTSSTQLSLSATVGTSVTVTRGVNTSRNISTSVNMSIPLSNKGGSLNFGGQSSKSHTVTFSTGKTTSSRESIAFSENISRNVPPMTTLWGQFHVSEKTIRIPFSASVLVDGKVDSNLAGYSKISDVLSIEERTFPITGFVEATGATDTRIDYKGEALKESECDGENRKQLTIAEVDALLPIHDLSLSHHENSISAQGMASDVGRQTSSDVTSDMNQALAVEPKILSIPMVRAQLTPSFSGSGQHQCQSSSDIGHTCSVWGVGFTDCNIAMASLTSNDCCPMTRQCGYRNPTTGEMECRYGGTSVGFTPLSCTPM